MNWEETYEWEQRRQAERFGELQEQVQRLEEAEKDLKPQLGRTEALAEDLKQQVQLLVADYSEIAEVLSASRSRILANGASFSSRAVSAHSPLPGIRFPYLWPARPKRRSWLR